MFQMWTVFCYNLKLGTILFVIRHVFQILQQKKITAYFCSQLIPTGYVGCLGRPKKQQIISQMQEQIQELQFT